MALNVLIVDDSKVMRSMVLKTMKMAQVPLGDVIQAGNGQEGLDGLAGNWIDLVLVEGFKSEHFAKIELHRAALAKPYLHEQDEDIIAIAADHAVNSAKQLPLLDLNQPEQIADFIYQKIYLKSQQTDNN